MSDSKNTKHTLAQSLKQLMRVRPFAKISVGDICQQCGVSRKSFYYHFQDKYDLMNWVFHIEFVAAIQQLPQLDSWQLLLNICTYFYKEQIFYRNALSVSGQNSFQEYLTETLEPFICMLVQEMFQQTENLQFFVTFYTDAFLAAFIRWLNDSTPIKPEEFAHLLFKVFPNCPSV